MNSAQTGKRTGTTMLLVGAIVGALAAYGFQLVGGRVLGEVGFAPVAQLWTVFFFVATVVLVPLEQFVTREVSRSRSVLGTDRVVVMRVSALGVILGVVVVLFGLDQLFGGNPIYILQMAVLMAGYSTLYLGKGIIAGSRRFSTLGWVLIAESVVRLLLAVVVLWLAPSPVNLGWTMVAAPWVILLNRFWRFDRGQSDLPAPSLFFVGQIPGAAASQLLIGAAPAIVAFLGADEATQSSVFQTFTLYRAPLTLTYSLQGRVLPGLVDGSSRLRRRIITWVAAVGSITVVVGGVVGWLIGPEVVGFMFGEGYAPKRLVAALGATGMMALATAQIMSQALVAQAQTRRLAAVWISGVVVAAVTLLSVSGEPDVRVAWGFVAGAITALLAMSVSAFLVPWNGGGGLGPEVADPEHTEPAV
ncbi:MAG: hypothetical protein GEU79_15880 [Acidimicrobiia bacterium]|nr:hypothetical protein [Acidimicrobiia bacterium]